DRQLDRGVDLVPAGVARPGPGLEEASEALEEVDPPRREREGGIVRALGLLVADGHDRLELVGALHRPRDQALGREAEEAPAVLEQARRLDPSRSQREEVAVAELEPRRAQRRELRG